MTKPKEDVITETEFTKLNIPKKNHHYQLPSESIYPDENANVEEETLLGMEYDLDSEDELDASFDEAVDEEGEN